MDSTVAVDNLNTAQYNTPVEVETHVKRSNVRKNLRLRDKVIYDIHKEQKEGEIVGFNSGYVKILRKGHIESRENRDVYKKDEFLKIGHWDFLSDNKRAELLKSVKVPVTYYSKDWAGMPENVKKLIKEMAQNSPYGVATRGMGNKKEKTRPGNDKITENEPSPAEHVINTQ